jgi:two-component system sensor histidine kinase CiaH
MFKEARVKLTAWYLAIIMVISLSFSGVIYFGINQELIRIETFQKVRIQRIVGDFPTPIQLLSQDVDAIAEARSRIILILGVINMSILVFSGVAGYFLAERTLEPIKKNLNEQKDFVSNASHELRTPLTALKTEIEVSLRDKKMNLESAKSLITSNLEEVNRMQKLSNYLLELNRYEVGHEIPMTKVDLKEIALSAIGKRNVKTDIKKSIVVGNVDAIHELITILLDNAFKYSPKKAVVTLKVGNGKIEVQDNGIGISKEDLPHIFDRFYRSDKSRSKDGYGLGLSIAKSIMELHKGKIEVGSKLGKGTTFKLSFRLQN